MFTRNLLLLCLVLLAAIAGVNQYAPEKFHSPYAYYALAYFFTITLVIYKLTLRSNERSPQAFFRFFMGSTALKLFLHLTIAVAYRFLFPESAKPFLVSFMLLYLVFQVFEVSALLNYFKKN